MANFYTAQEVASSVRNIAEAAQDKRIFRMSLGIPEIDNVITPLMGGGLYGVLACTGEAKTFTLNYLSYSAVQLLRANGIKDKVVMHIGLENSVEESYAKYCAIMGEDVAFASIEAGKVNIDKLAISLAKHASIPVIYMGVTLDTHFMNPDSDQAVGFGGISIVDIHNACVRIEEEFHMTPAIILGDYLQLMKPANPAVEKFMQVEQIAHDSKMLALTWKCPVVDAIQAKQEVKQRRDKIPTVYDAQHSSAIAQTMDGCIAQWMPIADMQPGEKWFQIPVTPNLIITSICKWRNCGGRGKKFALLADFTHNTLSYSGALSAWL